MEAPLVVTQYKGNQNNLMTLINFFLNFNSITSCAQLSQVKNFTFHRPTITFDGQICQQIPLRDNCDICFDVLEDTHHDPKSPLICESKPAFVANQNKGNLKAN